MKNPGFKIIDRYIIGKFLGTYLFAIGFIIIIVVVFDCAEKIDDFIELKAPLYKIAFSYYLNFIPYFVNQFSGLFTFIAVIFFTSKMAYNTEIIAILSGGVSFKRLLWPYFISAAIITVFSIILNLFIIPIANQNRLDFETEFLKKGKKIKFEKNIYRQIEPGIFAYVRDYDSRSGTATFFVLEAYQNGAISSYIEAANVSFNEETKHWSAPQYIEKRFEGEREILEKKENLDTLINLSSEELGKVENLIKTMNFWELNHFIKQQKDKGSDLIRVFQVEKLSRVAYPMATFVLTLIGVSLSSRKVRGGTGLHIGIGIALCFSFILFIRFAEEFAKGGVMPIFLAVWLPNIVYAGIAIYLYKKAPK